MSHCPKNLKLSNKYTTYGNWSKYIVVILEELKPETNWVWITKITYMGSYTQERNEVLIPKVQIFALKWSQVLLYELHNL